MARTFYMLIHTKKRGANSVTRSTCRGSGIAQFAETSNANTTSTSCNIQKDKKMCVNANIHSI